MRTPLKRQNFNTTPEQDAELLRLRELLDAPSVKDAVLQAARVIALLAREANEGQTLYMRQANGDMTRLIIPELEPARDRRWTYLVARPHEWRRQLYVKGRKLLASTVWADMQANNMTVAEAADNWSLPVEAIEEATRYCEIHRDLLRMEAEEEDKRISSVKEGSHESAHATG